MKKILLAFDSTNFSTGVLEFARRLNEISPVLLTGVFLPQVDYANLWSYAHGSAGFFIPLIEDEQSVEVEKNIERFQSFCQNNNIDYRVHKDFSEFALPQLKKETRYADLLIIGSETFYEKMGTEEINLYLRDALQEAECPVLVVPENFTFPERIVLSFDGSESSVYAIKQFSYLFPELCGNDTLLVYAKDEAEESFPDEEQVAELAARHFSNLTLSKLSINPQKYFSTWVSEEQSAILISGAFGRSSFSLLFKKSFVADVIKAHRLPVFIAHK